MRYFDIETSFNGPHVRGEYPTLEDAKVRLGEIDVFTETQMRNHPELTDALERWDRGDRSLFAHDHARAALEFIAEGRNNDRWTEFFGYVDGFEAMFRDHADSDRYCALIARLIGHVEELQEELKSSFAPWDGSERWDGPRGEIRAFSSV